VSRVDSSGLWVRRSGDDEIPLHRMSDGYRSIVALVLDIISQLADAYGGRDVEKAIRSSGAPVLTLPGVVLIDEVDAHLHVSWQQRIGTWLKQHFPAVQFIVTSHSPYICQAADPNGLIRLAGPTDESAPEIVSDQLYRRVIYGTGDDAVLSDLFGLDTPYSADARELRGTLVRLEAKVVTGRASEAEATEYAALRNELSSSPATRVAEVAARLDGQDDPHAEGSADR
jgi:hypothetical protein